MITCFFCQKNSAANINMWLNRMQWFCWRLLNEALSTLHSHKQWFLMAGYIIRNWYVLVQKPISYLTRKKNFKNSCFVKFNSKVFCSWYFSNRFLTFKILVFVKNINFENFQSIFSWISISKKSRLFSENKSYSVSTMSSSSSSLWTTNLISAII